MKKGKILNVIGFLLTIYLFIFSLTLIKVSSESVGKTVFSLSRNGINELNAFGFGWLATLIT